MELTTYIVFFTAAFILAMGIIPVIVRLARKIDLTEPNDERKLHTEKVSSLGGVGILAAFAITILLLFKPSEGSPLVSFTLVLPLFIIGLLDDLFKVGVMIRFTVQALLGILLYEMGFHILHLENLWWANMGANVLFIMLMVNAYNFIDGINGLAGGLGLIGSMIMGGMLVVKGQFEVALFCFAYGGSLLGFLCFNFGKKAQIFMGDSGSTVLGYFMAVMIMSLIKTDEDGFHEADYFVFFGIVAIPVSDIFKVSFFRLLRGQSPFMADRTHIHHLFTDGALSHPMACAVLLGWTLLVVSVAANFSENFWGLPLIVILAGVPYMGVKWLRVEAAKKKNVLKVAMT